MEETKNVAKVSISKNRFSYTVFLVLAFLLPIFFVPLPYFNLLLGKQILIFLAVFLLCVSWLVERLKDGVVPKTKNPIIILSVVIPVFYFISTLVSGSFNVSLIGQGYEINTTMGVILMFLLMLLAIPALSTKKRIYNLYLAFFSSFFILSIFQILRLIFGADFLSFGFLNSNSFNLVGKWNEMAVFYGLTALLSVVLIEFVKQSKLVKFLSYIILLISLFFVALVNFSLVWIVLGLFALLITSFVLSARKFNNKNFSLFVKENNFPVISLLVLLLSVVFVVGGSNIGSQLSNYFAINNTEVRPAFLSTYDIYKASFPSIQSFVGVGPNMFVNQWLKFRSVSLNMTDFWSTDFTSGFSFLITAAVNVGLLGLLLWIAFIASVLYQGSKSLFSPSESVDGILLPMSFLSVVYLWIFSLLYVPTNTLFALTFLFTGVLLSILVQNKDVVIKKVSFEKNQKLDFILIIAFVLLFLIVVAGGYFESQKFVSYVYSQKGIVAVNTKDGLLDAEKYFNKATKVSPNDLYYRYLTEVDLIKIQQLLNATGLSQDQLKTALQQAVSNVVQNVGLAVGYDSSNYQNWLYTAKVYEMLANLKIQNSYDQAVNAYINAINLNPLNPFISLSLGIFEYNNKNYDNAVIVLERAVKQKPDYSDAKYYLGLTYYYMNRDEEAIAQFNDLITLNPDNNDIKVMLSNMKRGISPFKSSSDTAETEAKTDTTAE